MKKNKKGILISIAVSLLLLLGCSVLSDTEKEHPDTDTETIDIVEENNVKNTTTIHPEGTDTAQVTNDIAEVWVPQSGAKYHSNSDCSNMKNPSQVSLSYAISAGYTACKRCY